MIRPILIAILAATAAFAQEATPDSRLHNATTTLREIMGSPDKGIPEELIEKAQCVVVVPDLLKGAFIVGGKYGRGYASCRVRDDHWSAPGAVRIEGGSFGFQLGGSSTDLVMLVMNENGMHRLLGDKFTIGGEAAAAAGPVGRHISAQTDIAMHAEILTWSRSRGLFAGISLDGATLRPDNGENEKLYGKDVAQRDILMGRIQPTPATRGFVAVVARIARPGDYETAEKRGSRSALKSRPAEPAEKSLREPGGRLRLGEKEVHFATGQSAINADAEPALNNVAKMMKDNPGWTIRVEGYTDNVGRSDSNQKLSQQRAQAVMNWLADHGVDRSRMTAKGHGASRPVADNSTDDGRAKNRRVEIVRTDNRTPTGE
ncbi:MAG: OmpA family protein [Acidobacteriia bacterium]|nr:OmpA family protein [Terriglobia bacterium]